MGCGISLSGADSPTRGRLDRLGERVRRAYVRSRLFDERPCHGAARSLCDARRSTGGIPGEMAGAFPWCDGRARTIGGPPPGRPGKHLRAPRPAVAGVGSTGDPGSRACDPCGNAATPSRDRRITALRRCDPRGKAARRVHPRAGYHAATGLDRPAASPPHTFAATCLGQAAGTLGSARRSPRRLRE